ncbi:hypothetical protein [Methylobacterium durans]|uniref:helix-turn-helix transcriptional regulator n=1 Tax=Methylobacterium durans TaxID=2202825 RepID=UPI001AEC9DAA
MPETRISEIIRGRRWVSAEMALRPARYIGTSAEFWMGMQALSGSRDRILRFSNAFRSLCSGA